MRDKAMGTANMGMAGNARGFLTTLARDVRGNTIAIMAAALIPIAGMVGGGVDLSRMYIVKTRLQHACDAGALAGRKSMGGGTWAYNSYAPRTAAEKFFEANIATSAYGVTEMSKSFSESAGKVTGTASATLPMTIMRIFGHTTETLTVTCEAEMRLPNTDVMFVLDNTGSMADKAVATDTLTKMDSLKLAVKCFYEVVARLDTDATCDGGAPSGGTGSQTQIRFGFVPYSSNVNVGKLLPTSYFANSWTYQSRVQSGTAWGDWSTYSTTNPNGSGNCVAPANTSTTQYRSTKYSSRRNDLCDNESRSLVPNWRYAPISVNIAGLKNGTAWNNSLVVPDVNDDGSDRTVSWGGCIEERATVRTTDYDPIPADAEDLDIDQVPVSTDARSLWGPTLNKLIWARGVTTSWDQISKPEITTTTNYYNNVPFNCPAEGRKLQTWPSASTFDDYVDGLVPTGSTYHDIGMLWGARFISPTGIFASENATTPLGADIERHLIFMTDGDTATYNFNYTAYGLPWLDRRQTSDSTAPSDGDLDTQVDLRLIALCNAVKAKNITLWVIAFGTVTNDTRTRLEACSTPGRYFNAADSAALQSSFRSIANQISQLRLTR